MKQYELFINGEFVPNGDREMLDVINPATEEVISQVPKATKADVDAAVDAAFEAQKSWGKLPAIQRANYLMELAGLVRENRELFARTNTEEMGKPLAQSMDEAGWLGDYIQYFAAMARHIKGEIIPSDRPNENIFLYKMPIGVVAGIMPWNFPLFLIGRKVAPALIAGDTVVLKPSSDSPNGCYEFAKLVAKSSLPKGVINVVSGSGSVVGDALSGNPKVSLISMTGSTGAGKKIMKKAADNVTKVSLELGGKAPVIVMNDCKLDETVEHVYNSRIINSGQVCNAAERIYVQEGIADKFIEKIIARFQKATYGPGLGGDFDLGPMVNKAQQEHVDELVQSAIKEGAKVRCGGKKATVDGKGFYYEPTVVTDCTHDMTIMKEEIFGPVLPISTFKTLDEAIEKANDCVFGLTSSIYTQDFDVVMRALNEIKFGETYVNREHFEAFQGFHQGVRQSGLGGDDGEHGLDEFMETHICYVDYDLKAPGK
ncbi:MAG: aldehyde dehydrogenase [Anaerovibrio sp.]|jgi:lactaldehyde dehydrogenase/glycolaldehyde dehydrogenase|uniref:3-sulfolactaldehyde dehydrogenase n=4 Tax=Anaerovibrio lipolyticus TaxID=82374 RepID=A0A0B2K0A6_9FIRM|nr:MULTISPECIES: aldehyde dehydrogenase [Anaerovibrio]KHM53229.1 aldehyde dehydrogenase [Anaerovibrio lipolyticus]MBE6105609.1 aldehyde dehydrogenase [Anaerovibrio lipolyticus]MBO5589548.1 aldehyde dehydrogenase [Anaerovibrio sp.]MBO6245058.1 aldehyde dehydrogenase [Anaerovibrio sp.]SHJ07956.1 lactaldehyde dehydrogenase / glycolaldehyde dehydrogenase [Anaerovibrio lipolyticus DSM 3074]